MELDGNASQTILAAGMGMQEGARMHASGFVCEGCRCMCMLTAACMCMSSFHPRTTSRLLPHSKYVCLQFHSQYICSHAHPQQALFHLPPQDFNTALSSLSPAEAELVQSWARADIARKHTWVNIGDDKAVRHGERMWQTCN